jgi:FkbM family methyltransferase
MLTFLRRLRHGPLRFLGPFWTFGGDIYRGLLAHSGVRSRIATRIGTEGPFLLDGRFAFSNFEDWGRTKNEGFDAIVAAARGAACVLDLGAHIGLVSLPVSRHLAPGGKVYAFEPSASNRRLLERHLALNRADNVEIVDALVGEADADAVVFYEAEGDNPMNTIARNTGRPGFAATTKRQVSVDSFCQARGLSPDIVKIDVEGAEIGVLEGAREVLQRHRPTIFLSVHPRQIAELGHTVDELAALIEALGYRCFDHRDEPVARLESAEYQLRPTAEDHAGRRAANAL